MANGLGLNDEILDSVLKILRPVENFGNGVISDTYDFTGGTLGLVADGMDYVKSGDREQWRGMSNAFLNAAQEYQNKIDEGSIAGKIGNNIGYALGGAKIGKEAAKLTMKHNIAKKLKLSSNKPSHLRRIARNKIKNAASVVGGTAGVGYEYLKDNIAEQGK